MATAEAVAHLPEDLRHYLSEEWRAEFTGVFVRKEKPPPPPPVEAPPEEALPDPEGED